MTRSTRRRGLLPGRSRALLAATLAMCGLAVAGCGTPAPLSSLTDAQRTQVDAAWSAIINATDSADLTELDRASRVKALYQQCKPLDRSNALLAAIADSCDPFYVTEKLAGVVPTRCAKPAAICMRALDRQAAATDTLAMKLQNLNAQAKLVLSKSPTCQAVFTTTGPQLESYGKLSSAYRVVSLGVQQKQKDIASLGQRQIADAELLTQDKRTAAQRMAAFRSACGLDKS